MNTPSIQFGQPNGDSSRPFSATYDEPTSTADAIGIEIQDTTSDPPVQLFSHFSADRSGTYNATLPFEVLSARARTYECSSSGVLNGELGEWVTF